ncbi:tRNA(His) guanylyltransferase Thg1 family protein [Yinghuangia seranimata]|uniref:tRNA(His) guanylyltransferase Thg1 family protein n=1 Tax=Yinghuangia seranimata TaxID=408067 RepID=UPI00248BBF3B|nr:tRNA(His) guanylyltransferase Thg1 family protein [Yinghuangia seranimata]MDI2128738.1 tRNA(His) guanylyltransferase Thg1 family protein [Yinghuangia seranimata]
MGDSTGLGDRMKGYEAAARMVLPQRTYTVIRVDGRAFHTYMRGARKPFDDEFMAAMDRVAEALCTEVGGAAFAYTQSDEVSVLATDFAAPGTEPWFGGVVAKQVSVAAAVATAELNAQRPGKRALFDARVFTVPDAVEAANYFLWRQRDAVRNSVSMAAQACFSQRRLHGVSVGGMRQLLLDEAGVDWGAYPEGCKRGRVALRRSGMRETTWVDRRTGVTNTAVVERSWWISEAAPEFSAAADGWLATRIPSPGRVRE